MFLNIKYFEYFFNAIISVNSPSIAGTGRVGPRQRSRITYSSHSDVEVVSPDTESFSRPKYEDRTKGVHHENLHKSSNSRKSQLSPKKKDFSNKSPYFRKKDIRREDEKYHETESPRKEHKESQKFYKTKLEKSEESLQDKTTLQDNIVTTANEKESNIISSGDSMNTVEIKNKDNQNDNLNLHINKSEVHIDKEGNSVLQNLNLSASEIDTEIDTCKKNEKLEDKVESPNVQAIVTSECETTETNLNTSSVKDDNDENDKYVEHSSYDANEDTKEPVMENTDKDNSEQTKEILSDNCDNKQTKDMSEQENDVKLDAKSSPEEKEVNSVTVPSLSDVCYIAEQNDELRSENKVLKEKENLAIEDEAITITDEKINTGDIILMKHINETQERTDNNERENNVENSIVVDKIESLKNLHVEEEKAASSDQN